MPLTSNDLDELVSALQSIKTAAEKLRRSIEVQKILQTLQSSCALLAKHAAKKAGRDFYLEDWALIRDTGLNEIRKLVGDSDPAGRVNSVVAGVELKQVLICADEIGDNIQNNNPGKVENGQEGLVNHIAKALLACRDVSEEQLNEIYLITATLLRK